MTEYIQINPADNVAVALHSLSKGTVIEVNGNSIELTLDLHPRITDKIERINL